VCTAYWDQEAWDKFGEGFRPEGYTGGIHDQEAYDKWFKDKQATAGIPSRNIDWSTIRNRHKPAAAEPPEIELRQAGSNSLFIYYEGGLPFAVAFWGSQDAGRAQAYLERYAFVRCSRDGCGVRLGGAADLGKECRNHAAGASG